MVCIPRLTMKVKAGDDNFPFTFSRRRFPLRPAFAMTINKVQGQTFDSVGIYLPNPVFCHGQLYVWLSRCGVPDGVFVMVAHDRLKHAPEEEPITYTYNIVYREIFDGLPRRAHIQPPADLMPSCSPIFGLLPLSIATLLDNTKNKFARLPTFWSFAFPLRTFSYELISLHIHAIVQTAAPATADCSPPPSFSPCPNSHLPPNSHRDPTRVALAPGRASASL